VLGDGEELDGSGSSSFLSFLLRFSFFVGGCGNVEEPASGRVKGVPGE
jgi:hypothetical protein